MVIDINTLKESAFKRAKKISKRYKGKNKFHGTRTRVLIKLGVIYQIITNKLEAWIKSFPYIEGELEEIVKAKFNINEVRKSFAVIIWFIKEIRKLWIEYSRKVRKARNIKEMLKYMKQYYARVSDLLEYIRDRVETLNKLEIFLNKIPKLEEKYSRMVILGPPNSGKSTLLKALTKRKVKVANYPFTTKELQEGIVSDEFGIKISLIDTPGIIRDLEDYMNRIEKLAYKASNVYSKNVIFIFDPTEEVLKIEDQMKLFKKLVLENKKEAIVIVSKIDLVNKEKLDRIINKIKEVYSGEIILANLLNEKDIERIKKILFNKLYSYSIKIQ